MAQVAGIPASQADRRQGDAVRWGGSSSPAQDGRGNQARGGRSAASGAGQEPAAGRSARHGDAPLEGHCCRGRGKKQVAGSVVFHILFSSQFHRKTPLAAVISVISGKVYLSYSTTATGTSDTNVTFGTPALCAESDWGATLSVAGAGKDVAKPLCYGNRHVVVGGLQHANGARAGSRTAGWAVVRVGGHPRLRRLGPTQRWILLQLRRHLLVHFRAPHRADRLSAQQGSLHGRHRRERLYGDELVGHRRAARPNGKRAIGSNSATWASTTAS